MSLDPSKQTIVAPGGTGFEGFGEAIGELLTNIIQGVGTAIAGGVSAVGGVFGTVVEGAISLIRGIGGMIASILTKRPPAEPLPEVWSPIKADLEGQIKPFLDSVDRALEDSADAQEKIPPLQEGMASALEQAAAANTALSGLNEAVSNANESIGDLAEGLSNAASQEDYNTLNTAFVKTQTTVNENQSKWNKAAEDSLTALEESAQAQVQINDLQARINDAQSQAIAALLEAQKNTVQMIPRFLLAPAVGSGSTQTDHFTITPQDDGKKLTIDAVGTSSSTWKGQAIVTTRIFNQVGLVDSKEETWEQVIDVPNPATGGRKWELFPSGSSRKFDRNVKLSYFVDAGVQKKSRLTTGRKELDVNKWTVLPNLTQTVTVAVPHIFWASVTWEGIAGWTTYRTRLEFVRGGVATVVKEVEGGLTPAGGAQPQSVAFTEEDAVNRGITLQLGDEIRVSVLSSSSGERTRTVRSGESNRSWIEV
ncbi:hypothetical protein [Ancrocorticia populi]|uniref:hypothetical protein n=1 Tax=Ancrocorticia populi TaxID=2175228 RepID=UPI003F948033